jgi:geranylgeranyl reductase family protein
MIWDVAVVGAGPAGASAARVVAEAGRSVVIIERESLPRYKLCGGGLIGPSLAALPAGFAYDSQDAITSIRFTYAGRLARDRHARTPVLHLINRPEFDAALVARAVSAGAELRSGVTVRSVEQSDQLVTLQTDAGPVQARAVVGADGSAGRLSRHVGATFAQVDLGLELELPVTGTLREYWRHRVQLDWGPIPGSYGWVFPKDEHLTVGVIGGRENGAQLKTYLAAFVEQLGLSQLEPQHSGGHLTRVRATSSPLTRGRALVAGDAAGFLEPWTREGISFALRSGAAAGAVAADLAAAELAPAQAEGAYRALVAPTLFREMAAGASFLRRFTRRPQAFHLAIAVAPPAWDAFCSITRGEQTLADVADRARGHRLVRAVRGRGGPTTRSGSASRW